MLAAFRKHITARLAAIWLVVAIPLLVILALTFLEWYQARLAIILQERQGYALSAATSFDLLLTQMRLTMRVSGGEIADAVSSGADATPALRRLASLYPAAYAAFADERGAIVASSEASSVGSSLRSDAAFQQALKSGDGGGLEPSEVARDGTVGFHVAQMIPARPGRPAGIVLLLVDVRRLHAGFPVTVPSGGVSIVDSAGQVVFQNEVPRFAEERSPWGAMFPFVREALRGRAATTRDFHFPLGGTRLAVFVPISRIEWAAGSSISPAVALAPFYRTLAIVFPIGAVVLSLALFSSLLLSRGIHRSLDGLATDARRIGSGDLTEAIRTTRSDEIGDVARSLEAARLELKAAREQATRELESTQVLLRAADALARSVELKPVLDTLAEQVLQLVEHTRTWVFLWNEGEREAVLAASAGSAALPTGTTFPFDDLSAETKTVVTEKRTHVVDYDAMPPGQRGRAEELRSHTSLLVPLVQKGQLVGLVGLDDPGQRREFTEREIQLIESVAAQAATAIQNALLANADRERARFGTSMAEINATLASSLSILETLPTVLGQVCHEVGAYVVATADRVENGWRIRELAGDAGSVFVRGFVFPDAKAPTLMRLLRERVRDVVVDVATVEHANRAVAEAAGYRAYVAQPLVAHGEVFGALGVFFAEPRVPSEAELDYFRRVAFAISLSEENSRLYESEHRIAETLQTALLALPDHIPGVEFAHLYRSATEAARVGGDFYDLFGLGHDAVGITVGDISGHGVDAAVLTSLVKNAIRVQATQEDKTPDEVVAVASNLLYANSPTEIFATVFFGVLRLDDGLLEYCSAGHTTGACVCGDGGVRKLSGNGPLIGAFDSEDFGLSEETLGVGDVLFLYTDGLTEARRDHELFGEERLFDLLAGERGGSPQRTLKTVFDAVLAFAGDQLSDDLAILALTRAPRAD